MKGINQFPKTERLCGVTAVSRLFATGSGFVAYPFKCVYVVDSSDGGEIPTLRVLFSVGKRYNKRAVERNKIKRRAREAYRLNKQIVYENRALMESDKRVQLAFIYISKKEENYLSIEKGVKKALHTIKATLATGGDLCADCADKVL